MKAGRHSRTFAEWIQENIKSLMESSNELETSDIHYPGHSWSVVKLLLLGGWVYVYTTIIPRHFPNYQYVDILAGSGTTCVKETSDVVAGSPFVAHFFARNKFTGYIFFEKNHERCDALRQRANKLLTGKVKILEGDCNELVGSIFTDEWQGHSLVFIDNEGFDVVWNTVEAILKAKTDILILFPTSNAMRVAKSERTWPSLDRFYGSRIWSGAFDENDFLKIYIEHLEKRFRELRNSEPYVSSVRVGSTQFFYDIILVCKTGPYKRAWEYLKTKLDWQNPAIVKTTLDILKGRATRMDWFLENLEKEVASIESTARTDYTQKTTLDRFLENKTR